jgi:membrane-associated phospholipid phosphatase
MRTTLLAVLTLVGVLAAPATAVAQATSVSQPRRVPLFTRDDAYLGGLVLVSTVALWPLDSKIAEALQKPNRQANRLFQNLSRDVRVIAVPGAVIIGTSMYVAGRLAHSPWMADVGLHGEEALLAGDIVTTAIKWTAGRGRPFAEGDTIPHDFELLRGLRKGRDFSSFPSGHALAAFSAAAAVTNEMAHWWKQGEWYVGPVLYAGATAVAVSRLYNNQHWASDVIMGAGIGIFAGNKIVRYNHRTHPDNAVDRWLLSASIHHAESGGLAVSWSLLPSRLAGFPR